MPEVDALRTYRARLFVREREVKCIGEGEAIDETSCRSQAANRSITDTKMKSWAAKKVVEQLTDLEKRLRRDCGWASTLGSVHD